MMGAVETQQIKKPSQDHRASDGPNQDTAHRNHCIICLEPPLFQNWRGRKKIFPEQLFGWVNSSIIMRKYLLQLYSHMMDLLQSDLPPAGSHWGKILLCHLFIFAGCCCICRAYTPSSWLLSKFYLPFNNKLPECSAACLHFSIPTLMSPFFFIFLAFTIYTTRVNS